MGNKGHLAPISIFMAKSDECNYKEILHPGGLLTGKHITFPVVLNTNIIIKYSSSNAGNIWPVHCTVYKCLPFLTLDHVPCRHSISYSY